ncbi:hypothetical protein SCUCBS95973_006107 [Sporothrix curviconia]|uniref:RRM domain-containing protein n=1 Tax=Sporothrix curviconia TaxID=1260050 RepID=A0ABP0C2F4_9PEZI
MADREVAQIWTFPTDISQFDDDERISYSRLDRKYIAVQDDGTEFEFDQSLKRWIPLADDDDEANEIDQEINSINSVNGSGNWQPESRKRKPDHSYYQSEPRDQDRNGRRDNNGSNANASGTTSGNSNKRAKAQQAPRQPKQNTAVYVTGLPADATVDEVAELFSRKCGVIAEEIDSGRPRIKMYTNSDGTFKGDALVVFFKPQSVDMAIMLLDDTEFRFSSTPGARMHVQAADASYKKTNYQSETGTSTPAEGSTPGPLGEAPPTAASASESSASASSASASAPAPAPAPAPVSATAPSGPRQRFGGGKGGANQDKQKIIKKTQKLDAKLADWSSDEDERFAGMTRNARNAKWDKTVVLKHMFTLAELEEDPAALLDIKEDIREECSKLGEVTNVVLFDQEAAGIVSVKFKTADAAAACVRLMGGRAFDRRIVEASLATGREKYKKSKKGDDDGDKGSSEDDDD